MIYVTMNYPDELLAALAEIKFLAFAAGHTELYQYVDDFSYSWTKYGFTLSCSADASHFALLVKPYDLKTIQAQIKSIGYQSRKYAYRPIRLTKPRKGRSQRLLKTILNDADVGYYYLRCWKPWKPQ